MGEGEENERVRAEDIRGGEGLEGKKEDGERNKVIYGGIRKKA